MAEENGGRRFALLDRDGTLIAERHYLADPREIELLPGVATGLRRLRQLGLGLAVITNQSGVGRGYFTAEQVGQVHRRLGELLEGEGVRLDGFYFCPHAPEVGCLCRKPATGLVERAACELGFVPRQCLVVGDRSCDIELGRRIGATTFLVRSGLEEPEYAAVPDFVVEGMEEVGAIAGRLVRQQA
jgi:histidinol-phosphate phosphatase family protein